MRFTRTVHAAAALFASLPLALAPAPAGAASQVPAAAPAAPGDTITLPVRDALAVELLVIGSGRDSVNDHGSHMTH